MFVDEKSQGPPIPGKKPLLPPPMKKPQRPTPAHPTSGPVQLKRLSTNEMESPLSRVEDTLDNMRTAPERTPSGKFSGNFYRKVKEENASYLWFLKTG